MQARKEGTDLRRRHDNRQAVRPSIPGGLCAFYGRLAARAPAGFRVPVGFALSTATGRWRKRSES
jgi:hypothetical protein